jgi:hypothetical protein
VTTEWKKAFALLPVWIGLLGQFIAQNPDAIIRAVPHPPQWFSQALTLAGMFWYWASHHQEAAKK